MSKRCSADYFQLVTFQSLKYDLKYKYLNSQDAEQVVRVTYFSYFYI